MPGVFRLLLPAGGARPDEGEKFGAYIIYGASPNSGTFVAVPIRKGSQYFGVYFVVSLFTENIIWVLIYRSFLHNYFSFP